MVFLHFSPNVWAQKEENIALFKIIFPVLCPIIYNPDCTYSFSRDNGCSTDSDCGLNEHCAASINVLKGQCRTKLADGSLCTRNQECIHQLCSGGVCTSCNQDAHCPDGKFCSNKYVPFIENVCTGYCNEICFFSSTCGGSCKTCGWGFTCE